MCGVWASTKATHCSEDQSLLRTELVSMSPPLRPGSKIEYVSKQLGLTNEELIEKAKTDGVKLTRAMIDNARYYLRTRYGVKNTGSVPRKKTTKKQKKYKARAAQSKPAKTKTPSSSKREQKHAELRKLVFELGYDEVRDIFMEFEEMHSRWS
jgi:hypothetical protein